jgi:hypothetical protein
MPQTMTAPGPETLADDRLIVALDVADALHRDEMAERDRRRGQLLQDRAWAC